MTGAISISHPGLTTVDLTNNNCSVQYVSSNPLFIVPIGGGAQVTLNMVLLSVRIILTFDLLDGIGAGSKFKNLMDFAKTGSGITNPVTFTWGSDTYKVQIESFIASTLPGKMDYMPGCSITLVPHI